MGVHKGGSGWYTRGLTTGLLFPPLEPTSFSSSHSYSVVYAYPSKTETPGKNWGGGFQLWPSQPGVDP